MSSKSSHNPAKNNQINLNPKNTQNLNSKNSLHANHLDNTITVTTTTTQSTSSPNPNNLDNYSIYSSEMSFTSTNTLTSLTTNTNTNTSATNTNNNNPGVKNVNKKEKRLLRNRLAAKECRKKKKIYVQDLEHQAKLLELRNKQLDLQLKELFAIVYLSKMWAIKNNHSLDINLEEGPVLNGNNDDISKPTNN